MANPTTGYKRRRVDDNTLNSIEERPSSLTRLNLTSNWETRTVVVVSGQGCDVASALEDAGYGLSVLNLQPLRSAGPIETGRFGIFGGFDEAPRVYTITATPCDSSPPPTLDTVARIARKAAQTKLNITINCVSRTVVVTPGQG